MNRNLILSFILIFILATSSISSILNLSSPVQALPSPVQTISVDHSNDYETYLDHNGNLVSSPYKLSQNSTTITLETMQGSYVFNNSTCSMMLYNSNSATGSPTINSDSYSVTAELNGTSTWNSVNVINNAACHTHIYTSGNTITLQAIKSSANNGIFSINYTKQEGKNMKLTFSATNQNPSWTNYHIGMIEKLSVPRNISIGNNTTPYDLSLYNNTVLSRSWISNHSAQIIKLANNLSFNVGIGWNHLIQITIQWKNNQAYLLLDYTFNTPILQPGNTITVDPTFDTTGTSVTAEGVINPANVNMTLTVGNNKNRILIVGISTYDSNALTDPIAHVHVGASQFTEAVHKQGDGNHGNSELWYLVAPATGSNTITITFTGGTGTTYYVINAYSLYNVNQSNPIGATATNSGNSVSPSVAITPTVVNSWILDSVYADAANAALSAPSNTQGWTTNSNGGTGGMAGASQYNSSPTIGGSNTLSWTLNTANNWLSTAIELKQGPAFPNPPVLNTPIQVSSTSLNVTWSSSTGANWYLENRTSPAGGTLINIANVTSTFHLDTGLTPGTQYQYGIQSGNGTGFNGISNKLSKYTVNIAPTALTTSLITTSSARISVTNPTGNFSGYKIYTATPASGSYILAGTSSNTTNRFDLTSLTGGTQYGVKFSTRFALGSNDSALSANSTAVSFYTIPNPPSGLAISQSVVNVLHLTWSHPTGNSTVSGYKIERSTDYGVTYAAIVSNTGNSGVTYDDSTVTTGNTYFYRVSAINAGGTSSPTSPVSATVLSNIQLNPTGGSTVPIYNQTAMNIPFAVYSRNSSVYDVFSSSAVNGTINTWYHGTYGSPAMLSIKGNGLSTLNLSCSPTANKMANARSENGSIYFACPSLSNPNFASLYHINYATGTVKEDFTNNEGASANQYYIFLSKIPALWAFTSLTSSTITTKNSGNQSEGAVTSTTYSNEHILFNTGIYSWVSNNSTTTGFLSGATGQSACDLTYIPTNKTIQIDAIACDPSLPATATKFWNGMWMYKTNNYYTNATLPFFNVINASPYKHALTLTGPELGISEPFVSFVFHNSNGTDDLIYMTSTKIYSVHANTMLTLLASNRAIQSYEIITALTTSDYNVPSSNIQSSFLFYGPGVNTTLTKYGMFTTISGYTSKQLTLQTNIRTIDPQWTNDNLNYPVINTGSSSLFPIILTIANAPLTASLEVTNPYQLIQNIQGIWSITQLDSTHTAEFDLPPNTCANLYVADISKLPVIYNYEGNVCATGASQKTITYTNTLPINFWNLPYGVTSTFTPQNNGLTTSFHSTIQGTTYNVQIKNSTGATAQTFTFTMPGNATLDTQNYNVSSVSKPAGLFVYVGSNLIYSTYLGSALSLASVASFFNTYLSYQGFSLLAFIPIVFAAMFTRNTVGIGVILTVLCIATLSWLSIVVIPDIDIYIMILIAIIGLIAYRIYYG